MTRRDLLRRLLAGSALTAAGLYVPTKTYSFLWNNPLADDHALHLAAYRRFGAGRGAWQRALEHDYSRLREAFIEHANLIRLEIAAGPARPMVNPWGVG